jgi:hypothetical protein
MKMTVEARTISQWRRRRTLRRLSSTVKAAIGWMIYAAAVAWVLIVGLSLAGRP